MLAEPSFVELSGIKAIDSADEVEVDQGFAPHVFKQVGRYQLKWLVTDTLTQRTVDYTIPLQLR